MWFEELDTWIESLASFFRAPLWRCTEAISWYMGSTGLSSARIIVKGIIIFMMFINLIVCAIVFYCMVYLSLIPTQRLLKPVYFDFASFSGNPEATINLVGEQWTYSSLSERYEREITSLLTAEESYEVHLEFIVPDLIVDQTAGMTMVTTTAFSGFNSSSMLATSKRPILFPIVSPITRSIRRFFMLVPLVFGLIVEDTKISTCVFESFTENINYPSKVIKVTLESYRRNDPLIIHNALIVFQVQLTGVRWFIYHWFGISALFGISFLVSLELIAVLFFYWIHYDRIKNFLSSFMSHPENQHFAAPTPAQDSPRRQNVHLPNSINGNISTDSALPDVDESDEQLSTLSSGDSLQNSNGFQSNAEISSNLDASTNGLRRRLAASPETI